MEKAEDKVSGNIFTRKIIDRSKPYAWAKFLFLGVFVLAVGKIIGDNILGNLLAIIAGALLVFFVFQMLVNLKHLITQRPAFNLRRIIINISLLLLIGLFQQLLNQLYN